MTDSRRYLEASLAQERAENKELREQITKLEGKRTYELADVVPEDIPNEDGTWSQKPAPAIKVAVEDLNGICIGFADDPFGESRVIIENYQGQLVVHVWESEVDGDPDHSIHLYRSQKEEKEERDNGEA
jgi:hypothetical protein